MRRMKLPRIFLALVCALSWAGFFGATAFAKDGETALIAVAANFAEIAGALEEAFEGQSPHDVTVTTGSTGKLYAQIVKGAPFDVFLSADRARAARLEDEGHAVAGSRFTYAVGRLTLWSAHEDRISDNGPAVLGEDDFRALAIANPELAPYGLAARQTLENLGLLDAVSDRIVMGENIGQAFSMVATGNAELGFIALSYVMSPRNETPGSWWAVPADLHDPIRQDAVLTARGAENAAARAFLDFLKSDEAGELIERYGYAIE